MKLLRVCLLLLTVASAACSDTKVAIDTKETLLDSHSDQHLFYRISKVDHLDPAGKVLSSTIAWQALMTESNEPRCMPQWALHNDLFCKSYSTMPTSMGGKAASTEVAKAVITEHFEEFKTNNSLVVAPTQTKGGN
jgi:hypothetical protein